MRAQEHSVPVAGTVEHVPIAHLRTSYGALRAGAPRQKVDQGAEMPLRVAPADDGVYEVIDGFKRLTRWREQGCELVPVVVERPAPTEEHKRLLLGANAPPRTVTALDEARVVCSLIDDDGKTEAEVARLLGKRSRWVARRLDIGRHLGAAAEQKLAHAKIGPTLAHALCALADKEQDALVGAIERHGLRSHEAIALVGAYRVADDHDRRELLRDPKGCLQPEPPPSLSAMAVALEARLEAIRNALVDLEQMTIPDQLAGPERRRIEALYRGVLDQLRHTARALTQARTEQQENTDVQGHIRQESGALQSAGGGLRGNEKRDHRPEEDGIRHAEDRPASRPLEEGRPSRLAGGGAADQRRSAASPEQARPLQGGHRAEGRSRPDLLEDPPRGQGARLPGQEDHPRRPRPLPQGTQGAPAHKEGQAPLRDQAR